MIVKLNVSTPRKVALRRARTALSQTEIVTVKVIVHKDTLKMVSQASLLIDWLLEDLTDFAREIERSDTHAVIVRLGGTGVLRKSVPDSSGPAAERELVGV